MNGLVLIIDMGFIRVGNNGKSGINDQGFFLCIRFETSTCIILQNYQLVPGIEH